MIEIHDCIKDIPILTTGQDRLHSCLHRFGLHLSLLTMAMRVSLSCVAIATKATYTSLTIPFQSPVRNTVLQTNRINSINHTLKQTSFYYLNNLPVA